MNPNGYTRLEETEKRLFRTPVKDMVDFPLVRGSYMYEESVILLNANGTYRCLEVWGNSDSSTTVGMVAGYSTPPLRWLPGPTNDQFDSSTSFFNYRSFPCSIVPYEWTSLEYSPPFVQWSGMFRGVPSGNLRPDVSRITIDPRTGTCLLYAPGMVNPPSSFRSPSATVPIPIPSPAPTPTHTPISDSKSRRDKDIMIAVGVGVGGLLLLLLLFLMGAQRTRRSQGYRAIP